MGSPSQKTAHKSLYMHCRVPSKRNIIDEGKARNRKKKIRRKEKREKMQKKKEGRRKRDISRSLVATRRTLGL